MTIKITWQTKPQTNTITIDAHALGCKTKKMWDDLKQDEQRKRINEYLAKNYKPLVEPFATEWDGK